MTIISVVVALIAVAVILVGLPLVAWWVGHRRFWGRLHPSPTPMLQDELRRRLGLTAPELTQARQAAQSGRALTEPRMRAATAEVARDSLARAGRQWRLGVAGGVCTAVAITIGLVAEEGGRQPSAVLVPGGAGGTEPGGTGRRPDDRAHEAPPGGAAQQRRGGGAAVMVGLIAVGVILLGLPLLAWWLGGRLLEPATAEQRRGPVPGDRPAVPPASGRGSPRRGRRDLGPAAGRPPVAGRRGRLGAVAPGSREEAAGASLAAPPIERNSEPSER